jgi:hydroxyacylglutathione hydrolase
MYFERFYDEGLAQASYLVACPASGEALIVDPLRDIDLYFDRVDELGFEIVGVAETHIHADFLSGGRDLARASDATLYVSGETVPGWEYGPLEGIETTHLEDGDTFALGGVELEALHTPGHTPEHVSLSITDTAQSDEPMMVLTGDFAFVGDLGRPDLLEEAAGQEGTALEGARQQFESVRDQLLALPDDVQIWPGHGAGSACGKALGSIPSSTVGYERKHAWWGEYLENDDVEGFVDELLADQPESPRYFRNMKEYNRDGLEGGERLPSIPELTPRGYREAVEEGHALLLDLRDTDDFAAGHVRESINLPSMANLSEHAGWVVPYDRPLVLLADESKLDEARRRLYRIGFENFAGWIPRLSSYADELERHEVVGAEEARRMQAEENAIVLDVRSRSEYRESHVPEALHIQYGRLVDEVGQLPRGRKMVVHCGSGARASIAVSILESHGFDDVAHFDGDALAQWRAAGFEMDE